MSSYLFGPPCYFPIPGPEGTAESRDAGVSLGSSEAEAETCI